MVIFKGKRSGSCACFITCTESIPQSVWVPGDDVREIYTQPHGVWGNELLWSVHTERSRTITVTNVTGWEWFCVDGPLPVPPLDNVILWWYVSYLSLSGDDVTDSLSSCLRLAVWRFRWDCGVPSLNDSFDVSEISLQLNQWKSEHSLVNTVPRLRRLGLERPPG